MKNTLGTLDAGRKASKLPSTYPKTAAKGPFGDATLNDQTSALALAWHTWKPESASQASTRSQEVEIIDGSDDFTSPNVRAINGVRTLNGGQEPTVDIGSPVRRPTVSFFGASAFRKIQKHLDARPHRKPQPHHTAVSQQPV